MRDPLSVYRWQKIVSKVLPCWIPELDQPNFLFAAPAFDLFLAADGIPNVREWLAMNESVDVVPRREARNKPLAMFDDSPLEIIGYAGIQRSGSLARM